VRIASLETARPPTVAADAAALPVAHLSFADTEFEQAEKAVARRFIRDTAAVEAAWDVIKETKDHTVIRHFVDQFPSNKRRIVADSRLAALGQKPMTVHAPPAAPLKVDEDVLIMAAADPDVLQCFLGNDQTSVECLRAFERFPDIGRFAEDIRITLALCQAMGNPSGCVPTVKSTWNFPTSRPDGGPAGEAAAGSPGGGDSPKTPMFHVESKHVGPGKHPVLATRTLKLHQGGGFKASSGVKTPTGLKTPVIKNVANATNVKAPKITTPAVKPPRVDVRVNIPIHLH
jgi:hypothetical protein